ncbi:MAG: LysM peptidoglycan-binding domain-containing protein [Kiritimatiellaeota bacterium]|nr:LysM peptidoglycan-binding domain-containing protein [Kiritimatiellota bacterium]
MLSRGSYGIEYDEDKNSPQTKYWWAVVLVPLFAVIMIFARSCKGNAPAPDDDPTQQPRFDAPETKVNRESASIGRHFFGKWFGSSDTAARETQSPPTLDADTAPPKTSKRLPAQTQKLLDQATADEQAGNLIDARQTLLHLLGQKEADELRPFLERKTGQINTALLFSKQPAPGKAVHTVARGDTPGKIAQRFGCPQEFIMEINGIERPENMRIGTQLHVLDNPAFELHIAPASASALLTFNGEFFKRYALIPGDAKMPPTGRYTVRSRNKRTLDQADIWTGMPDDKPRHAQDICWVTLASSGGATLGGISLQGTRNASTPDALTVRFRNPDIDELYLLLPAGTAVVITE